MLTRSWVTVFSLAVSFAAGAQRPRDLIYPASCEANVGSTSVAESIDDQIIALQAHLREALACGVLVPERLDLLYRVSQRGSRSRGFITYITKQIRDDMLARATADRRRELTDEESIFISGLELLRKRALAYGERFPEQFARVAERWRISVREVALIRRPRAPNTWFRD